MWRTRMLLVILAACGGDDGDDVGGLGDQCYPNGTCNVTLACSGGICVVAGDGGIGDGALSDGLEPDSFFPDAAVCDSDAFEPNDTTQQAPQLPLTGSSITLASVPLCPSTDLDTFRIAVTVANSDLEAITTTSQGAPTLSVRILNAGGTSINNGTASGPMMQRALAANLPVGTYYVQTYSTQATTYGLRVTLTQ